MHGSQSNIFEIYVTVSNYNGKPALVIRRVIKDPEAIQLFLNSVLGNPDGYVLMRVPRDKAIMAALKLMQAGVIKNRF